MKHNNTNYIVGKESNFYGNPALTVNNLAEIFQVSPRTVNRWYREERIKGFLINRKQFFHIEDVKVFYKLNNAE